ncbi:S8 family serine peptidase [Xanthomonas campestris]|uniref:S8 family serine peptidase n=1 Tax=Xanthomonas campestris TaxID=339 RepID=UPI00021AF655|nr:S8 family serine peptidase [Xanthomonas campestris]AEL06455.1 serine protease [Xanthomonas campestris pv. raphani 756C]MEA9775163.1 S8 family serine peptidase [Xanthomonas campestris pv. raphani]MEA9915975.1 S8 family serine peptidase [Xanthomonas campestris pv. raphani]
MKKTDVARTVLASALAVALTACGGGGGGGGGIRPSTPTAPPPTSPPPPPPPTSPPPPPPVTAPTPEPAIDAHLTLTNARAAQALGFTGAGYRIGVIDSGINANHPALQGRVSDSFIYVDPRTNNVAVGDVVGHGTVVAELAAGRAVGQWPGGIAPGAGLVSARIISDRAPVDDGSGQGNEVDGPLGLGSVHADLIGAGVRIMNNSWGGLYWNDPTVTNQIAQEYRSFVIGNDGLVVFDSGNESRAQPSDTAALPSQVGPNGTLPAADLERGWLVVGALDTANPTQLASYSNACGVAMRYCLVAPGTSLFIDPDATASNIRYFYGSGTSFAAPLVSGAAALVWQAFPYFNNDLVRQTLLGTATDLGAAGVDPTFGYGLLNVGKAVLGPARFDWGTVDVEVTSLRSTWANDISGSGGLTKRGSGTLILSSSNNTFAGDTQVLDGTLQTASLQSARVDILQGATLIGAGRIAGTVSNRASTLQVGDAVLAIGGNYTQDDFGRLALNVGDRLNVSGTATIDGDLQLIGRRDYVVNNTTYPVLQAGNGLQGTFASLSSGPAVTFLNATLSYDANTAYVSLQRMDVTAVAASLGAVGTASMDSAIRVEQAFQKVDAQQLQGSGGISSGFIRAAAALQQSPDAKTAADSLRSLSGRAHAASAAMTFDTIDLGRRALAAHFDGLSQQPRMLGTWQRALGGPGEGGATSNGFATSCWMMGNDLRLASGAVAGFAFGETRSNSLGDLDGARGRDRQVQAQLYWGTTLGAAYTLGQLGFGNVNRQIERNLQLGEDRSSAFSDYSGSYLSGNLETGYRWGHTAASLTPYMGLDYVRLRSEGFRESGGEGFGLRAAASTSSRTQVLAGMRSAYRWRSLQLGGYVEWQQALSSQGLMLDASFIGVEAWAPLRGMQPARSGGVFGIAASAPLGQQSQLRFGYDQRVGERGDDRALSLKYSADF